MSKLTDILQEVTKKAMNKGADQVEAFGQISESREVWLEANSIKMAKSTPSKGIGLRVIKKNSLGFASVNQLEDLDTDKLVDTAFSIASANLTDKFVTIPEPRKVVGLKKLYDPRLANLPLKEVISMAKTLLKTAKGYDKRVTVDSGGIFVNVGEKAIVNSHGLILIEKGTDISSLLMGMAKDKKEVSSFDIQFDGSLKLSKIKIESLAKVFAKNVVKSLGAKAANSFKGIALFSPNAVAETFLYPLSYAINAQNVQKGMSALGNKLGKKIAHKELSIIDDGLLPDGLASSAFDREGQPKTTTSIIKNGVLKTYLYNSYTAKKEDKKSTGHASGGYRSLPGIGTSNLIISPGNATKSELIKSIKEGVLVTRFSGSANPVTGDFSGTVKGGFYIRNGKVIHPITGTMIAGNVFESLKKVVGISNKLTKVFSYHLPYLAIADISVTSS